MKLQINQKALLEKLELIQGALETKPTIPILQSFLLSATESVLKLTSTNLDITLETTCEADINAQGSIAINGRRLIELTRLAPCGDISLETDGERLIFISGTCKSTLLGSREEHFPSTPKAPESEPVMLPAKVLRSLFNRTIHAATEETSRFCFGALLLEGANGQLRAVGTNGERISVATAKNGFMQKVNLLVPLRPSRLLISLCDRDDEVSIREDANHIFFTFSDCVLTSRKIEGNFPAYEMAIPKMPEFVTQIEPQSFMAAVKRTGIFTDTLTNNIRMEFEPDSLRLASRLQDAGESQDAIELKSGASMQFGIKASYLIDALKLMGESGELCFTNPNKPILLRSEGFMEIIAPARVV
jgi:DNA polymerase-3 subunit beta